MWTWGRPQRREGPLRLQAGPPLPQLSPLSPGPGASPQRPTEPAASPRQPSASLLPTLSSQDIAFTRPKGVRASSLCLQVPRCPLGRPSRQGGLRTVLHFHTSYSWIHPGLGGAPQPTPHSLAGSQGSRRKEGEACLLLQDFYFSLANIFFCKAGK